MKSNAFYSLFFTFVLCACCAALLTFANVQWAPQIEANENYARTFALVDALDLVPENPEREQVMAAFRENVSKKVKGEITYFEGRVDGKLSGYALDFVSRGKYGPIKGVFAIQPDKRHCKRMRVYEQQETPGLGGRVGTIEWLSKWDNVPIVLNDEPGVIISNTVKGSNVVDGITGASKTTFALGKSINSLIASFLSGGVKLVPIDFGTGPDAVTRATPGYSKGLVKPPHLRQEVRRAPFNAPEGVFNVALNKPVTSSMTEEPIAGELSQITDGMKKSGEYDYVEIDPGLHHVQIDLEKQYTVFCVVVWHYYKNPVIYRDVIIQVSNDPEFKSGVVTLFNNDHDNSSGLGAGKDTAYYARWWGEVADARGPDKLGTLCRYIRVYTDGGCGDEETRFVEISAWGK